MTGEYFFDHLDQFDAHLLLKKGVRLMDQLTLMPVQGRKKDFRLDRVNFLFESTPGHQWEKYGERILLPSCGHAGFGFSLCLVSSRQGDQGENARYRLEAMGKNPFILNGSYCFKAYLQRGDNLQMGHNKLKLAPSDFRGEKRPEDGCDLATDTIARSGIIVLIEGETGTGKTRLARNIHEKSGRTGKFVHINPSSFASGLIESELFGHVKGAFTGAMSAKRGAILEAHKGTLFLDEIDSLPLDTQTKLLLFLESKQVRAVGGEGEAEADVRIILASGRPLGTMAEKGNMRRDFYFRVASGIRLELKPLRERPLLIQDLCLEFSVEKDADISAQLIEFYKTLPWPGNVRQLLGHLAKKYLFCQGRKLVFDAMDEELYAGGRLFMVKDHEENVMTMNAMKLHYAQKIYHQCRNNLSLSARVLGITENTMRAFVKKRNAG